MRRSQVPMEFQYTIFTQDCVEPFLRPLYVYVLAHRVRSRWKSSQLELTDFGDAVTGAAAGAAAGELAT